MVELLPSKACWDKDDADAMLRIEALGVDDTLFLATHSPIRGFLVSGAKRHEVSEPTEAGLLDTLCANDRSHAFCVVQGDPGSGKSHLIRWLAVHWPKGEDLVLLLQRADGSLQGALDQLKTAMTKRWPASASLFENLNLRRQAAGIAGRAEVFQSTLGAMLKGTYFEEPPVDADWCDKHDLSLLIQTLNVRKGWKSPRRILELMDGKSSSRNSESAQFNLDDVLALARLCPGVSDSVASERFARRLIAEAEKIRDWLDEGETEDDIRTRRSSELSASLPLIRALNLRLNDAVQSVIGVTSEDLILLFRKVRTELKDQARLVLLLEDVTAWQGLDNGLIDALVLDSATRTDVCPLISVVGVTPKYYDDLQKNYKDRITHEVQLGESGGSDEAVTLRQSADRLGFASKYLNATRAGKSALATWGQKIQQHRDLAPPNPCLECPQRQACHAVFGEVDNMGLFPFTKAALDTFFYALKTDDKGQTHRTPRGLLQNVLGPTLLNPSALDDAQYPGPDIETEKFDERAGLLSGPMRALVEANEVDPKRRERLRRTFMYWGDPNQPETTVDADGTIRLAGVPQKLFTSFQLPWLGGVDVTKPPPTDRREPRAFTGIDAEADAEPTRRHIVAGNEGSTVRPVAPELPRAPPKARVTGTATAKTKLQRLQTHVAEARAGSTTIKEPQLWNEVLFELLNCLNPRDLGLDRWIWSSIFTGNRVQVAGSSQVRSYTFAVPREPWLYDGLEAYCAIRSGGDSELGQEYNRRRLAFMMRRLGILARAYAARALPVSADGYRWDIAASATQVLLARAWLKGSVSPVASTAELWRVVLSDEEGATTAPQSRTEPWQDALRNTDQQHDKIRAMLREMVSLPQGNSTEFGLAAAGAAARAIVRLQRRLSFLPIAEVSGSTSILDDRGLAETAEKVADCLRRIPNLEFKLLQDRAAEMDCLLRGESLASRVTRLNKAAGKVFPLLRELPPELERRWRESWERISADLERPDFASALQRLILAMEDREAIPQQPSANLAWLISQPAGDLRVALEALKFGEQLCKDLNNAAASYLRAAGAGGALGKINKVGQSLKAAVAEANLAWEQAP
ncbi:hypothetical protein ABIE71_002238 [Bradyrhizobium diazoefficiens]